MYAEQLPNKVCFFFATSIEAGVHHSRQDPRLNRWIVIPWDLHTQTDKMVLANQLLVDKQEVVLDLVIPSDGSIKKNEHEKRAERGATWGETVWVVQV